MGGTPTITPGGVPSGKRREKFASTRLLHEWAQLQPWEFPPIYELRLGPTPLWAQQGILTPQVEAMLRNFNRYADLVGVKAGTIEVVEAKMFPDPGAISQVELYVDLVHATPVLQQYPGRVIQPVILVALSDAVMAQKAAARGIKWVVYTPTWASEYVERRYTNKQLRGLPTTPKADT
jgi:hypothetical protein